ncbi:DUF1775 domain-containing protein [Pseudonocardia kunmingensis]|uniref:DUF1775 domain-containing protein n=1 Tax=Pseudonocardia kunmingensis TaxID=630975 RepID=UPI001478BB67|nr:DUF1775 domain-containing protein [Pseudonocardia kunmingensis]
MWSARVRRGRGPVAAGRLVALALLWPALLGAATPAAGVSAEPAGRVAAQVAADPVAPDPDAALEPDHVERGARDVTLRVLLSGIDPAAPAVRFRLFLPTGRPLVGVTAPAVPGWTSQVTTTVLPAPAPSVDGPVHEVVSEVAWTATAPPTTGAAQLVLHVDLMPDGAGPVRFRAVLSDASGRSVEWTNSWADGGPRPAHDALELALGAPPRPEPAAAAHGHHHGEGAAALPAADAATPGGIATTVGALLALAAVVGALVAMLSRRQRRRFEAVTAGERGGGPPADTR